MRLIKMKDAVKRGLIISFLVGHIIGCSAPVIDASTQSNLDSSSNALINSQPKNQQLEALKHFSRIRSAYLGHIAFRDQGFTKESLEKSYRDAIDGMNYQQIVQESERVQQAWELADLVSMRKSFREYQRARSILGKIKVKDLTFFKNENGHCMVQATIVNGSDISFSSVDFRVEKFSPEGSSYGDDWLDFDFRKELSPGMEQEAKAGFSDCDELLSFPKNQVALNNFRAMTLRSLSGKNVVNIHFGSLPSKDFLKKKEVEYFEKYGKNEPQRWKENILRSLEKQKQFVN